MDTRQNIKEEFTYYLSNVARSSRRTEKGFNLQSTAVNSFLAFLEPERLFDYNPENWRHIKSMYDITAPNEVEYIANTLLNDKDFIKHDNDKNQGWRSGSIIHYVCFIKARSYFLSYRTKDTSFSPNTKDFTDFQQIFYGAPGTGKSYSINKETKDEDVIRTTFHPDTDYSTFVGAYKPTTKEVELRDLSGHKVVEDGEVVKEDRIVYEFVAQSFLQAYVSAWKKYADANEDEPKKQYLVIEEINRGNCAQIFGDLFQLLDRNDYGFSDYPIKADADMKRQLQKAFAGLVIAQKDKINALYKSKDVVSQVLDGDILLLPNNLYIWATMNTSDQSLFPIDSAFKRRWDWTYMPISDAEKNWIIEVDGSKYDWWQFLEKINEKIGSTTNSEDKKLGYFFCKAQNGVISAKTFVGKVIFYLWNDVFKDYEFGDAIFNDEDGSKLSFDKFYEAKETKSEIVEEKVRLFLQNLGVEPIEEADDDFESDVEEDKDENESNDGKIRLTVKFPNGTTISGKTKFDSYIEALKEIGLDKAEKIASEKRYHRLNCALITKEEEQGILNATEYSYVEEQGFYIVKGINGRTMRNMLKLLSQQLNLQLEIIYE